MNIYTAKEKVGYSVKMFPYDTLMNDKSTIRTIKLHTRSATSVKKFTCSPNLCTFIKTYMLRDMHAIP